MGFLDKTITKAKASAKATSSKYNESRDANKILSQIKTEKEKVRGCYETIGKEYYRFTYDGDESHKDCFDGLVNDINTSRRIIEDLEAQLAELRAKGQEERDSIKADTDAKIEEIESAEAESRAQKDQARKDKDDVF